MSTTCRPQTLNRLQWRSARPAVASAVAALLLATGLAQGRALSFADALDAARANDAPYRSAGYEYDATRYGVPIARAQLMPAVSLNASANSVGGSRQFPNAQNQEVRTPLDYTAPQASLNVRVPLFHYEALSGYRQAAAQSEVAEAVYRLQGLDLAERLASAYMQTLLAEQALLLYEAQVKSFEMQAAQAVQRLQRGEGTRVQVSQAQATLDVARTRVVEAQDLLTQSRSRLERLTGIPAATTAALPPQHMPAALFPERLGDWLEMAVRQSPGLQAQERSREVARQFTRRQQSGHLPRVDLVASLGRNENDSTNAIGQSTVIRSVGVQLSMPLYSGGGVDASVQQAKLRQAQVEEEVRKEREAIELDVQRHYQAVVNGEQKLASYIKALDSTALAVQGATRSLETGLGTISQLADAQSVYYASARDLAQARVETLLSRVRLMLRAGMPLAEVATEVDRFLVAAPAPVTTQAPK